MAGLILDSEALSALAHPHRDVDRHQAVVGALTSASRRRAPVCVPSAVLVEVYRGKGHDEPIDLVLGRTFIRVVTTGARIARTAGHLLAASGRGSAHAIDALVVATAVRVGGGIVVTHDPSDLTALAAGHPAVRIVAI